MATRNASPTAQLLRSSRLFSLPKPLPEPTRETLQSLFVPGSATSPYPVRQAIARPHALRRREDWGLKRSLPTKAAGKGQAAINIIEHDRIEEVTDYRSANGHALVLQKWQEMSVPMRHQRAREATVSGHMLMRDSGRSAFNRASDITDRKAYEERIRKEKQGQVDGPWPTRIWKYNGRPVADMTDGDFELFLEQIGEQNSAKGFKHWLRRRMIQEQMVLKEDEHRKIYGPNIPFKRDAARKEVTATADVEARLKQLRAMKVDATSTLNMYIEQYLRLSPRMERQTAMFGGRRGPRSTDPAIHLSTHPSAGLSYMTGKTYLENHPIGGPRAENKPVQARMLSVSGKYVLGVGGVAAQPTSPGPSELDVTTPGGAKRWVVPEWASVDDKGRIQLAINQATTANAETAEGDVKTRGRVFPETDYRPSKEAWSLLTPASEKIANKAKAGMEYRSMVKMDTAKSRKEPEAQLQQELMR